MNDSQHISTDDFAAFPPDFPNSGGLLTSSGILQGLQRSAFGFFSCAPSVTFLPGLVVFSLECPVVGSP